MASYTYSSFHSPLGLTIANIPAINTENLVNTVIGCLKVFGADIPIMTGTAGSKTVTLSDKQFGGVMLIFRPAYASFYKNAANKNTGGIGALNVSTTDLMSNPAILTLIKDVALQLKESDWSRAFI